ncbi:MAG TPA: polysaccharide lyase family protein [Opitutaceae bacterium]|nr:polysaccharide lyase family protein [Opitutaceae bacterium]
MKTFRLAPALSLFALALLPLSPDARAAAAGSAVTVQEDATAYTLDNGIVTARVDKGSGDLVSLRYRGTEILATILGPDGLPDLKADPPGANSRGFGPFTDHQYGFWSHDAMGPRDSEPAVARVTIDPKANGGERGEVSVKGISHGRKMGTGPGSNAGGQFVSDIEIRYALGRGDSGVYTYSIFEHQPDYAASSLGEARFCAKLADFFDWMTVGAKWSKPYPKEEPGKHEDKYDFTTVQSENPAFGWSSTTKNVSFWLVNPTVEYLSGGPTKVEFLGHRDTNAVAAPCVLNYWRSSHYGGAVVDVAQGEHWTKVVGPFFLYVNTGRDPQAMFQDAQAQQLKESRKWPYDWVQGVDYPHKDERSTVSGRLVLSDPMTTNARISRLQVGLTHPAYSVPRPAAQNAPSQVDWQTDAKFYEFWVKGDGQGRFSIPNVRAGTYTLHAFADGVLGEFAQADVVVAPGKSVDLGRLTWVPVRRGRQLWDIGVPNRTGGEFFKGDDYAHDGMPLQYAKLFPNDVSYVVGKSDYSRDWYYEQVPHTQDLNGPANGIRGGGGTGRATPYTISFDLPSAPHGKATLRVAFSTAGTRTLDVEVNGRPAGKFERLPTDSAIGRNGILGVWFERELPFDAALLKAGTNTLKLTVPAGLVTAGIIYDYLRLELDESAAPPATTAGL